MKKIFHKSNVILLLTLLLILIRFLDYTFTLINIFDPRVSELIDATNIIILYNPSFLYILFFISIIVAHLSYRGFNTLYNVDKIKKIYGGFLICACIYSSFFMIVSINAFFQILNNPII